MLILEIEFRAWHRNHSTSGLSGEWLKVTTKGQEESKENFFLLFFFFFFFSCFSFFGHLEAYGVPWPWIRSKL